MKTSRSTPYRYHWHRYILGWLFGLFIAVPTYLAWGKGTELQIFNLHITHHTASPSIGLFCIVVLLAGLLNKKMRGAFLDDLETYDVLPPRLTLRVEMTLLVLLTAWLLFLKQQQYDHLLDHGYDLGVVINILWNLAHGNGFWSSYRQMNFLANHFAPFLMLLSVPYRWDLWPTFPLVAQTLFMMVGIGLVNLLGRSIHPVRASERVFLILFFVLNMYFQKVHAYDFHPIAFSLPVILGLYILAKTNHWRALYLALPLVLFSIQEDVSLMVMGLGLSFIWAGSKKHGTLLLILSGMALYVNVAILMSHFGSPSFMLGRYVSMGTSIPKIAMTLLCRPWIPLRLFFTPSHLGHLLKVLLSFGLLPIVWGSAVLSILPSIAQHSLCDYSGQYLYGFHYSANLLPFLMIATVVYLARQKRSYSSLIAAFLVLVAFSAFQEPRYLEWTEPSYEKSVKNVALTINPGVAVSAQDVLATPFSFRKNISDFPEINDAQMIVLAPAANPWPLTREQLNSEISRLRTDPGWRAENYGPLVLFKKVL